MKLAVTTHGDHNNPALLFLHGFLGNSDDWLDTISYLSTSYYCVALDLPGHGKSHSISISNYKDIVPLIETTVQPLLTRPASFVGYSMGARIGLQLFVDHSSYFNKYIFISGSLGIQDSEERKLRLIKDQKWANRINSLDFEQFLHDWYRQDLFQTLYNNPSKQKHLIEKRKKMDITHLKDIFLTMSPANTPAFHQALLSKGPFAYFYGEKDQKYAMLGQNMIENYPSAIVRGIKNSSHAIHLEQPGRLADFIQKCEILL